MDVTLNENRPAKKQPYTDIALLPYYIASTIVEEPYEEQEYSAAFRSTVRAKKVEELRSKLTQEEKEEFAIACDKLCQKAYEKNVKWFMRMVNSQGPSGRDSLYNFTRHWMVGYLKNRAKFLQKVV